MILIKNSVSFTIGVDRFGNDIWTVYMNSPSGRADLAAECPPEIVAEVMAVWGGTPTMPDPAPVPPPDPAPPIPDPRDLAIAQLMRDVAALKGGAAHV